MFSVNIVNRVTFYRKHDMKFLCVYFSKRKIKTKVTTQSHLIQAMQNFTLNLRYFELTQLLKRYFYYKTIASQNVLSETQVKNFLFHIKVMIRSQDIQVFVF